MSGTVECGRHGPSRAAFVCRHLVDTLRDGVARGLIWTRDADGNVNAYCELCDRLLAQAGDEWTDDLERQAGITLICEGCFGTIRRINGATGLNS